ncbi:hypothetical protein [Lysobacter sp. TY2-98]|nr:hypothetical protein [Lysobacter sp. TY2-98]
MIPAIERPLSARRIDEIANKKNAARGRRFQQGKRYFVGAIAPLFEF